MYPYLKFMNSNEDDDLILAPLNTDNTINNGLFIPEEFIEEFRTSSVSENPLEFDFREVLLNSDINSDDEDLKELLENYKNDSENYRDELKCYNSEDRTIFNSYLSIPTDSSILRELDLDIDEEVLELERDLENSYEFELRNPQKFQPFFPPVLPPKVPQRCNPEIIFRRIEANNPRVLRTLQSFRMPYPVAKRITKQIISLTLSYCPSCNRGVIE